MSNCSKGKSCGGTCIEKSDRCRSKLPSRIQEPLTSAAKKVSKGATTSVSPDTRLKIKDALQFDKTFHPVAKINGSQSEFDWGESAKRAKAGAKGGYATVLLDDDKVVKRGEIGQHEASIIRTLGEADLGPRLLQAETGKGSRVDHGLSIVPGRIAMSRVPGKEMSEFKDSKTEVAGIPVGEAYWKARAQLHQLGIAHNDSHHGNVLIDDTGKARFVDLGLAKASPKAAFAEAMGVFANLQDMPMGATVSRPRPWGDYVAMKKIGGKAVFPSFGGLEPIAGQPKALRKMRENKAQVFQFLRKKGLTKDDVAEIIATGIRQPDKVFEQGPWGRLTNQDAQELTSLLYKGV